MTTQPERSVKLAYSHLFIAVAASVLLLWSYWSTLAEMLWRWNNDPQYSHGFLVPSFAGYLLWLRRGMMANAPWSTSVWGFAVLIVGCALRLVGTRFHYGYLDQISLLPCVLGILMILGGIPALRWSWPAVAFLCFMVPLPHAISMAMSGPMQSFATQASTFVLQTLGRPAVSEGNVILINDVELGIVEACSGLRMLVVFFALSTGVALLIEKPIWERLFVAASAVPIALASNVIRIAGTGLLFDLAGDAVNHDFVHDAMGWLMMPIGLAFLVLELWVLNNLLLEPDASTRPARASQVTLQRVEIHPVTMYAKEKGSRRARTAAQPTAEQREPEPQPQNR